MKCSWKSVPQRGLGVAVTVENPQNAFELGRLHADRGDFLLATELIAKARELYLAQNDLGSYLNCQNLLLRIYAEQENESAIQEIKENLQSLVSDELVHLTSKTHYTLALCASYRNHQKVALDHLEKALALALATDDKRDICYAISGLALVYFCLGRYDDALREIYNLQVFFQVLPMPEMKLSMQILNGHILRKKGHYREALDVFWQCYDGIKVQKNLWMFINTLYAMGVTYSEAGDPDMGRVYLNLALKAIDPESHRHSAKSIKEKLDQLGDRPAADFDIVYNPLSHSVVERKKGRVDFKNQFILLDLLRIFLKNPGEVYTKEALVSAVWRQEYDPSIHDNKIYVTIKRLRRMIEPDFEKPKYIFRAKNGYYLNRNTKVLIEQ